MSSPCISSTKVSGTAVYNANGDKLGSIDDGLGTDRYPLPWNMLKYDTRLDGYVVPLQKAQLENAPRYERTSVPDYSDNYGRKVYDYYGAAWE